MISLIHKEQNSNYEWIENNELKLNKYTQNFNFKLGIRLFVKGWHIQIQLSWIYHTIF